jgi:hypothetical protein
MIFRFNFNGANEDFYLAQKSEVDRLLMYLGTVSNVSPRFQGALIGLGSKNSRSMNVGHYIASVHDAQTMQKFLAFLFTLVNQGADPQSILNILNQIANQLTIGHMIAHKQDADTIQQYVQLLSTLLSKGISPKAIIDHLNIKNGEGKNISDLIERKLAGSSKQQYSTFMTTLGILNRRVNAAYYQGYLSQVSAELTHSTTSGSIFNHLSQPHKGERTIGHAIARNQDAPTIAQYLTLLSTLLARPVVPSFIIDILNQTDQGKETIGHLIARSQDAGTTNQYLLLLFGLLKKGKNPQAILKLLNIRDENGWKIGHRIVAQLNHETTQNFIKLLFKLGRKEPRLTLALLEKTVSPEGTIEQMLHSKQKNTDGIAFLKLLICVYRMKDDLSPEQLTHALKFFDDPRPDYFTSVHLFRDLNDLSQRIRPDRMKTLTTDFQNEIAKIKNDLVVKPKNTTTLNTWNIQPNSTHTPSNDNSVLRESHGGNPMSKRNL